jgi:hypothetical protein
MIWWPKKTLILAIAHAKDQGKIYAQGIVEIDLSKAYLEKH